jgi:hypothetical protein
MSRLQKIVNERGSVAPTTHIDDLAPTQQELSMSALNHVVAGGDVIRGGTIVVKGGCDGSVDHVNKTCD